MGLFLALSVEQSRHFRVRQGPSAEKLNDLRELHRLGVIRDDVLQSEQQKFLDA